MIKAFGIMLDSERTRIVLEMWESQCETFTDPESRADLGSWFLRSNAEKDPTRVLTMLSCLGYALDSKGNVVNGETYDG